MTVLIYILQRLCWLMSKLDYRKASGNRVTIRDSCCAQEEANGGLGGGCGYGRVPGYIYILLITFTITFWSSKRQDLVRDCMVALEEMKVSRMNLW